MKQELIDQLYTAVEAGTAKVLTESAAIAMRGKKIATLFFGYRGQNGLDEFIVGDIVKKDWIKGYEPSIKELYSADGRMIHRLHYMLGNSFFSGSDSDREVYYIELE